MGGPVKYEIEAPSAKYSIEPPSATDTSTPTPSMFRRFGTSYLGGLGVTSSEGGKQFFEHPVDTLKGMVEAQGELGNKSFGELKNKEYSKGISDFLYSMIPGMGPTLAHSSEQLQSKDYAGGVGTMLGAATLLVANPERVAGAVKNAPRSLGEIRAGLKQAAEDKTLPLARRMTGARGLARDAVKSAGKQTVLDNQKHMAETQQVLMENKGAEQAVGVRQQAEADLEKQTDAYFAKEGEVQKKAASENDANWNKWREKVKDVQVDMTPVRETIEKVGAEFPEAKKLLSATEPSPEGQSVGNQQFLADRTAVMKQQGYGADYEALNPERKAQVDSLMERMGLAPEESEGIDASQPMSVQKLHELKSRIGWKLARNEYPPDITGAMKQVYKALEKQETRGSIEANALDELKTARESHKQYQEAFGRTRPTRTVQSDVRQKSANPEAFKEQEEQDRLAAVGKYDPQLAKAHESVSDAREKLGEFASEDKLRRRLKQPPDRPGQRTVDLNEIADRAVAEQTKRIGRVNVWDVRIALSALIAAGYAPFMGGIEGGLGAGVGYLMLKEAMARGLESEKFARWVSQTPAEELAALRRLPNADQVQIKTGIVKAARAAKVKTVSPAMSQYLGPAATAAIVSGQGQIKNRKDALQALGR